MLERMLSHLIKEAYYESKEFIEDRNITFDLHGAAALLMVIHQVLRDLHKIVVFFIPHPTFCSKIKVYRVGYAKQMVRRN